jgi:hypothetical protein
MIIYLFIFAVISILVYLKNVMYIKWNFDYSIELEKQCLVKK